ncbi:glycerophosphodiester phosphodiesterase family protein [Alphaproteobacteria bacterium]|nr:glycerophosphodiester phosphodiesterase family protein [Alphaproteobacteria bacterium]
MLMDKLIGHRGISGFAPENTMAGFNIAKKYFKWIEVDACLTSDDKVVLFHDEFLNKLTNDNGKISDKTFNELQELNVNLKFPEYGDCKISLLSDLLNFVIKNNMYVNIEIKHYDKRWKLLTNKIIEIIEKSKVNTENLLFSSFKHDALIHLNKKKPKWKIGHLFYSDTTNWQKKCKDVNAKSIHLYNKNITKSIISQAKDMGLEVYCYTVNTKSEYEKLINLGVDGVFTDEKPETII